jgi:DNA-binding response OmpR family regulator
MLLTVHAEQGDIERSVEVGADDHMSKPFDLSEFVQRIEALAAHRT